MKSRELNVLAAAAWAILAGMGMVVAAVPGPAGGVALFDGRTFAGWEGDTNRTWRIRDGVLVGGSLQAMVPQNEFLATVRSYTNFVLALKFRLVGTEGFVNGGVQFRSERVKEPASEMCGYQADIGDDWWGVLYDESRRNKPLVKPDAKVADGAVRKGEWNDYVIRCEGRRIRTWLNGVAMVDYTEPDESIVQQGRIGLQIHGGAKAEIAFRDLVLEELK